MAYNKAMSEAASKREASKRNEVVVKPPPQLEVVENKKAPWNKGKTHISRKTRGAITHLATKGGTITDAAAAVGMSRSGLSKAMQREDVRALLDTEVSRRLAVSAARAAHTLDTLVAEARSERVQLEAATAILDRTGHGVGNELLQLGQAVQIHIDLGD
ncbi:MAG: hypothetical protein CME71_11765 [Halobacteriovorax sp.]|nr:hypothetical protein [Halobacteriovorax sp.]